MSVTDLTFSFVWILISEVKSAKCQTRLPPIAGEDDVFLGGLRKYQTTRQEGGPMDELVKGGGVFWLSVHGCLCGF